MNEDKTLGIYIHIPFCASKCGYCDFYSCAGAEKLMGKYQEALLTHVRESLPQIQQYYIDSVYFGGGNCLSPVANCCGKRRSPWK